jgi:hypothetical protein
MLKVQVDCQAKTDGSLMKSGRRKMLALRLDDDGKETWKMPKDVVDAG